jgi:hypothetical protein
MQDGKNDGRVEEAEERRKGDSYSGLMNRAARRIAEVLLFGTPSGGMLMAGIGGWLKNQIVDMSVFGAFIKDLRTD